MTRLRFIIVFVALSLFSVSASAQSEPLARYAPQKAEMLVGLNMASLKQAPIYAELFEFLKNQPRIGETITFLQTEGGLDVQNDLEAVLLALPKATANPDQTTMSIVIRGKLNKEKLIAASTKKFADTMKTTTVGKFTYYETPTFSFGFASDTDLVMTVGEPTFGQKTWKAVGDEKSSATANKDFATVMKQINTTRSIWMAVITREVPQQGPKMNTAGFTVDVVKGLKTAITGNMAKKKDAADAAKQFKELKAQRENPMVAMVGAGPLLDNLKTSAKGKVVTVTTSMTAAQFGTMLVQLKGLMAQGMQAPNAAPAPTKTQSAPAKTGVQADFN